MFGREDREYHDERGRPMALHDYRRSIDVYGGGMVAVEIDPNNKIELLIANGSTAVAIDLDAPTAGVLLDAIAGAIRELEGLA